MAIYSFSMSNVSRAKGSSSCSSLAYISGEKIHDERLDKTYQYAHADRVVAFETLTPAGVPAKFQNAEKLFNEVELFDKSQKSKPAKKIIMALPREFDLEKQKKVVREFIQENITSNNYACSYAIHHDKEDNNPHCHILIANRKLNDKGFEKIKSKKEYVLDSQGQRVPLVVPATGKQKVDKRNRKQWKRRDVLVNQLDTREYLQQSRESWANVCNKYLEKENQIDHRSNEERGLETIPTIHEGYYARAREKQGMYSERCQKNRDIKARNNVIIELINELKTLKNKAMEYVQSKGDEVNERLSRILERRRKTTDVSRGIGKNTGRTGQDTRGVETNAGSVEDSTINKIDNAIENARTQLTSTTTVVENSNARANASIKERKDRELQRLRLDNERAREQETRSHSRSSIGEMER